MVLRVDSVVCKSAVSSPILSTRHGFANRLLMAARKFANDLREYEALHAGNDFGPVFDDAQWLAMAAYALSYSAIEAWINETIDDHGISESVWKKHKRKGLFARCAAVLTILGKEPIGNQMSISVQMKRLAQIRHGIVHPKAEWSTVGKGSELSQIVIDAGFALSPFGTDLKDAFPLGCMSAGGAEWAHKTASAFLAELRSREPNISRVSSV